MKKILVFLLLIVLTASAIIYNYLDRIVHKGIEQYASQAIGTKVSVDEVSVSLITGKFFVEQLTVANPVGFNQPNLFEAHGISVEVDMETLFKPVVIIKRIFVNRPIIVYEHGIKESNVDALKRKSKAAVVAKDAPSKGTSSQGASKRFIVESFEVKGAEVVANAAIISQEKSIDLPDIKLSNIGKSSSGVSIDELANVIFEEFYSRIAEREIKKLVDKLLKGDLGKEDLKQIKKHFENKIGDIKDSIDKIMNEN